MKKFVTDKEDEYLEIPSFLRNQKEDHDKKKSRDKKKNRPTVYCSFCGKSQHEVEKLIAGPTVFICDECTGLCVSIIKDAKEIKKS